MSATALAVVVTLAAVAVLTALTTPLLCARPGSFRAGAGPMIAALAGAFGIVLPAFVLFEPRHDGEAHGLLLPVVATVGGFLLCRWGGRAARMIVISRRVTARWTRDGVRLVDARWGTTALAIDSGAPIVAVAGILRPRIYVDRRVLESCTPAELDAVAAHERAHILRRDNLRRLLVAACSGPFSSSAAAWRESAELAADRLAASSPATAVDLAAALVKLSRLGMPPSLDALMVSTIHDAAPLERRVRRLLAVRPHTPRKRFAGTLWIAAPVLLVGAPPVLQLVHAGIEHLVRHLP
jgi:Zn-dependent protease with chaperone function